MSKQILRKHWNVLGVVSVCAMLALGFSGSAMAAQGAANWTDALGESSGVSRSISSLDSSGGSGSGAVAPDMAAQPASVDLPVVEMEVLQMQSNLASDFSSATDFNATMAGTFTTSASGVMAVAANRGASSSGDGGGGEDLVD